MAEQYACDNTTYGCDINLKVIGKDNVDATVAIGAWELKPEAYASAIIGIASAIQAFFFLWTAALADFEDYRDKFFLRTAIIGSILCCLFLVFGDPSYNHPIFYYCFFFVFFLYFFWVFLFCMCLLCVFVCF